MDPGTYTVWNRVYGPKGAHKIRIGRFLIYGDRVEHLETSEALEAMLPRGPIAETHQKNFDKYSDNKYFHIEKEKNDAESSLG
jgi:hypothetical protein